MAKLKLRVFLSSPGDVGDERRMAMRVMDRLKGEFAAVLDLEPIIWEHEPVRATSTFQDQIPEPAKADVLICVLWSRLGTRLPGDFKRPDGSVYDSGTAFELETALAEFKRRGHPDILVYRKTAAPLFDVSNREEREVRSRQWDQLADYLKSWFFNQDGSFKAGFTQFQRLDEFEDLLEKHLRKLIEEQLKDANIAVTGAAVVPTWLKGSPFRGLSAFLFEHAEIFHGRTRAIAEAKDRLQRRAAEVLGPDGKPHHGTAFLLVTGMSGSGKSSLVRAGLIPALVTPGAVEGIGFWRWAAFRPSEAADPSLALLRALYLPGALPELAQSDFDAEALAALLERAPDQALAPIKGALKRAAETLAQQEKLAKVPQARLALVLDQLEELFTDDRFTQDQRVRFADLLDRLAQAGFVWIVATLRSDFYPRVAELPALARLKDGTGTYDLLAPTGSEIAQMIRAPARAAGLSFEESPAEGGLDDLLQQSAAKSPASLPLLSFVLDELYDACKTTRRLTFAAYEALGGLEGAIAKRAEDLITTLPNEVQAALPKLLSQLITLRDEDGVATARTVLRSQIAHDGASVKLVEALVEARLLVAGGEGDHTVLRVTHEALLNRWPRAQKIIAENREFLQARARLTGDCSTWEQMARAPEELLPSGKRLAEAKEVLLARREELEPLLAEYIDASLAAEAAREAAKLAEQRRKLRRTQLVAAAGLALAVLAGAGAYWGITGQQAAEEQAVEAEKQRGIAEEQAAEAERQAGIAQQREQEAKDRAQEVLQFQSKTLALESRRQSSEGNATVGLLLALEGLPKPGDAPRPYVAEAEAALKVALAAPKGLALFRHQQPVVTAQVSPDGQTILTASTDTTARLWDAAGAGELLQLRGHTASLRDAVFSPDGSLIATGADDGTARLWDRASGSEVMSFTTNGDSVYAVEFSPDGTLLKTEGYQEVQIWDLASGANLVTFSQHSDQIRRSAFSPDGRLVASAGLDGYVMVWDSHSGQVIYSLGDGSVQMAWVAFSPDGSHLLSADANGNAELWNASNGEYLYGFYGRHYDYISMARFSADGLYLATASGDGTARLWDATNGNHIIDFPGQTGVPYFLEFSPDSQYLTIISEANEVQIWDTYSRERLATLEGHHTKVNTARFSADSSKLVTASDDNTARLWEIGDGPAKAVMGWRAYWMLAGAFSPDGTMAAMGHGNEGIVGLWDMGDGSLIGNLPWHLDELTDLAFTPDGRRLVTASLDNTVAIWDVSTARDPLTRQLLATVIHELGVRDIAISPDGTLIATASDDGTSIIADLESGAVLQTLGPVDGAVNAVDWSPDGSRVVIAADDALARVFDVASGQLLLELSGHGGWISDVQWSPDGAFIATSSGDGYAGLWNAETGELWAGLETDLNGIVWSVDFSPNGKSLVVGADHDALLWRVEDGSQIAKLSGHSAAVKQVAFSPDGSRLLTASDDGTAQLWSAKDGRPMGKLAGHSAPIYDALWSARGDKLLTLSEEGRAILWNPNDQTELLAISAPKDQVWDVSFSPDGTTIAGSGYVNLSVWDAESGRRNFLKEGHSDYIVRTSFSPDGQRLVTASLDGTVLLRETENLGYVSSFSHYSPVYDAQFSADSQRLVTVDESGQVAVWSAIDGAQISLLVGHTARVNSGRFSPVDANLVLTASDDGTAILWDATTGAQLHVLALHANWVNEAVFSPDGTKVATASSDGTAVIWDVASGAALYTLSDHLGGLWSLAFSPDGKLLATASADATARVWDVETGQPLFLLAAETFSVNKVIFSPEGDHIVTISSDQIVRVWDSATGTLVSTLKGHGDIIVDVEFSPNGRLLATASHDGRVRLWRIYTGRDLVSMARAMATRSLTAEERERFSLPAQ